MHLTVVVPVLAWACYLAVYHRLVYALLLVVLVGLSRTMLSNDPYGLFHLSLNTLPGEDPDSQPQTEWLNMGYWKASCKLSRAGTFHSLFVAGYNSIPRSLPGYAVQRPLAQ